MKRHPLNVFVVSLFCGLFFSQSVQALPHLGVIPETTLSTWPSGTPLEGPFAFTGGDPESIVVWYGEESGPPITENVTAFIATTDDANGAVAGSGHTFDGSPLLTPVGDPPSQWGNTSVYGTNYMAELPPVNDTNWTRATSSNLGAPLVAGGGEFFFFTGPWTSGLSGGQWIYAMADIGNDGLVFENGSDRFSPPTMSTVPEPSTVLLLGGGLLGLALLGMRRSKNRKA